MSTISAAVVVWAREGISASGSPPAAIAIVPPALLPESVPHPQSSAIHRIAAYLIAAMSNPRRETAEHAPTPRPEYLIRPTRSLHRPRAIAPRPTSRSQLLWHQELFPAASAAKRVATSDDCRLASLTNREAPTGHHRRGSTRVATKRRPLAIVRCRRVWLPPQPARPSPVSRSMVSHLELQNAQRPLPLRRAPQGVQAPFAGSD